MARRIGLLGGAFNPPHLGHRLIADRALAQLALDRVFWIPTCVSPHKAAATLDPGALARLAMVEAAIADEPRFTALDLEIRRGGVSYTVETLRILKERHPGAELFFILGADALAILPQWRDFAEVARLTSFAVHGRARRAVAPPSGARVVRIEGEQIEAASHAIREDYLAARAATSRLAPAVAAHIEANAWYAPPPNEKMRQHLAAVEEAAGEFARRWGLDEAALRFAGRCHDLYRSLPPEELLARSEALGLEIGPVEKAYPVLLHGPLAAARLANNAAGTIADPVLFRQAVTAVRYHTTGDPALAPFSVTLMIADQVGKIWKTAAEAPADRDEALERVLARKAQKLERQRRKPHHDLETMMTRSRKRAAS